MSEWVSASRDACMRHRWIEIVLNNALPRRVHAGLTLNLPTVKQRICSCVCVCVCVCVYARARARVTLTLSAIVTLTLTATVTLTLTRTDALNLPTVSTLVTQCAHAHTRKRSLMLTRMHSNAHANTTLHSTLNRWAARTLKPPSSLAPPMRTSAPTTITAPPLPSLAHAKTNPDPNAY